jgi:hypothetical protein
LAEEYGPVDIVTIPVYRLSRLTGNSPASHLIPILNSSRISLIQERINFMFNVNPEQYLRRNALSESLVIKMAHLQEKMELHLIIDFNFDSLQVERMLGRGVKIGDDFVYFDVDSGKELDFYNPF